MSRAAVHHSEPAAAISERLDSPPRRFGGGGLISVDGAALESKCGARGATFLSRSRACWRRVHLRRAAVRQVYCPVQKTIGSFMSNRSMVSRSAAILLAPW